MNGYPPSTPSLRSIQKILVAAIVSCALLFSLPAAHAAEPGTVNGNLLIEAKGEVEVYHNGRKIVLRDKADSKQHFLVKVPERAFKAGDAIVLSIRSPYVYRTIAVAINLVNKGGQIPVKKANWRFLGEGKDARNITAADIEACQELPATGNPDPDGDSGREKLGILPESKGGSEWVKTAKQLNQSYCVGFVLTDEMLKARLQ